MKRFAMAPTSPQELINHDCLYMSAVSKKPQWQLTGPSGKEKVNFKPAFTCDDFSVLRQMALDATGIAQLPNHMCENAIKENRLVRVLNDWVFNTVDIFALFPSHKGATPKVRAFLDFMTNHLQ